MKHKEKKNLNNNENEDEIHVHNYNTHTNVINSSQWIRLSLHTKYKLCAMLAILQPYQINHYCKNNLYQLKISFSVVFNSSVNFTITTATIYK